MQPPSLPDPRARHVRRAFGRALLLLLGSAAPAAAQTETRAPEPRRPNLVLIVADDLGYGDIGAHGCTDIPTPNIDSLAREGVRCTSGYASGTRCAPTRAGMMTGRYQQRYGCERSAEAGLPPEETTLAERLKTAGYATGLVGKWHLGARAEHHPLARGFDEFFGFLSGASTYLPRESASSIPALLRGRERVAERGYLTDAFGREAVAFVERNAEEPFFLYLAFSAPHLPLEAPPGAQERCASIADPVRRAYATMVASMDDAIGKLLVRLDELGLAEQTLVLFLSDNGAPLGGPKNGGSNAPLRGKKGGTAEGGIRVPFLARWKGTLPAGRVLEAPVISLDIHPTALALAGIEVLPEWKLDGVDILPHLAGRVTERPHEVLYWSFRSPPQRPQYHKWAIRRGDLKLVQVVQRIPGTRTFPESAEIGLYDVARDPGETVNLLTTRPDEARALGEEWQRWAASLPPVTGGGPRVKKR
jgi:arylsulfatase A-like enzyme